MENKRRRQAVIKNRSTCVHLDNGLRSIHWADVLAFGTHFIDYLLHQTTCTKIQHLLKQNAIIIQLKQNGAISCYCPVCSSKYIDVYSPSLGDTARSNAYGQIKYTAGLWFTTCNKEEFLRVSTGIHTCQENLLNLGQRQNHWLQERLLKWVWYVLMSITS